ncbi:response regulator transcription factor [Paenibacillus abyssi]|uniref:DNA-binding response regulator n=1 Tax=Paenibacillus abyssi TaxID=1340531 RepID=A0A917FXG1_9BACL|nr:response regulator transcription factor [Paenibacillus abyssi]GGG11225.1 hypothetical protein GCM10010916_30090 [Paenibacillus abyssi]
MTSKELCRVLIVDDEILIRQGIKHYLNWKQEGFQIVGEASNGKEALELIDETHPHIVLTDIVMPVMDGEELTRAIKVRYPDIEVVVLSSFGEFDYVRSTFQSGVADYILKPKLETQELLRVLRATAGKIPSLHATDATEEISLSIDQIIERLVAGYDIDYDPDAVVERFPYDSFCLFGVSLKHLPSGMNSARSILIQMIEAELEAGVPHLAYRSFSIEQNVAAVLLNVEKSRLPELNKAAADVVAATADSAPYAVFALSGPFTDFAELGAVYKEGLLKLLQYSFYFPDRRLIVHNEIPVPAPQAVKFNLNRFTEELKRSQFDVAFGELKQHVAAMTASYTTDIFEFKSFLSNIIFNVTVLLGNMDYDVKELEKARYKYFNSIDESRNADEAASQLFDFITAAQNCICSSASHAGGANMKMLLEYIDQHYSDPLSLKDMANHFHFNPSYLSSYFSTYNKEGFAEYLNKIRTEKAAELLRKDAASISEISGMVGYSDHSYFCKVFKKMTGLSPSQYRRQHSMQGKRL